MSTLPAAMAAGVIRTTNPGDWRNDLLSRALAAPRPEALAISIVDRFTAVRSLEKIAILTAAPTVDQLIDLDHYGVERIVGHTIPRARWTPRDLLNATMVDEVWLRRPESHIVWFGDSLYPEHLRRVFDPPAVLYGWGRMAALDSGSPAIAMVGTRNPDDSGRISAFDLGGATAARGMAVVSGLAIGIDAASHRGVLAAGCGERAIAVLGSGIDTIYPGRNREVAGPSSMPAVSSSASILREHRRESTSFPLAIGSSPDSVTPSFCFRRRRTRGRSLPSPSPFRSD
jgi:DNA processing protein